jgi:hypothetical protein
MSEIGKFTLSVYKICVSFQAGQFSEETISGKYMC